MINSKSDDQIGIEFSSEVGGFKTGSRTPQEVDELINAAIQRLVFVAKELGVDICELQCMLELGMTPLEVVD